MGRSGRNQKGAEPSSKAVSPENTVSGRLGWAQRLRIKLIFEHTKHRAGLFEEQGEDGWTVLAVSHTNNHRARSTPGSSSPVFIPDCRLGQKEEGQIGDGG